jgi:hypothetical protein
VCVCENEKDKDKFTNHIDDQSISSEGFHLFDRPFPVDAYETEGLHLEIKEG